MFLLPYICECIYVDVFLFIYLCICICLCVCNIIRNYKLSKLFKYNFFFNSII